MKTGTLALAPPAFREWLDQPRYPLEGAIVGVRLGINDLLFSMSTRQPGRGPD